MLTESTCSSEFELFFTRSHKAINIILWLLKPMFSHSLALGFLAKKRICPFLIELLFTCRAMPNFQSLTSCENMARFGNGDLTSGTIFIA